MNMLGATQNQLFNTTPGVDGQPGEITGFKPYTPYSTTPTDYFAGPSGLQTSAYNAAGQMQSPTQYQTGTQLATASGLGQLGSAQQAGMLGRQGMGIGQMGMMGAMPAFGAGQQYARQVTDPNAIGAYMSPYQQQVTDVAKAAAVRDAEIANKNMNLASARSGTYGGARQALAQAERERGLLSNLSNIQAQGSQSAYDKAIAAQQFGANLGLQGIQTGLQGTAQGMQGVGQGLQGLGAAQAGYAGAGQAASTLGQLGTSQQAADINAINLQNQLGTQQQQYQQNIINQQIQDYATAQQYPMMQLGFMSNMLRGLPMQSSSTQMYQAAPSAVSQLGGLAATGLGAYGAAGGFRAAKGGVVPGYKEGGAVQRYDVGGSVEAQLADMPDAKLMEIAKSSPSQEVRKIATKLLMEHRLEAQAQQQSGLAAAPAPNLDNMDAMAGGGIVAFQNRGKVELKDDTYDESLKQLSGEDLRRAQIQYAMDNAKNPLAVLNPGELWSGFKSFLANPENQNAAKRALASPNSPVANALPVVEKPPVASAANPAAPAANPNAPEASPAAALNDGTGIAAAGKYDARIEKLFADLEAKSPTAGLAQEDLNKLREDSEKNKDRKLWQALMMGGAKAMSGKSQYALSNIGEGIAGGVEDYVKSEAGERADKKLLIAQQSALEQAEYARKTGNLNALVAAQARLDNVKLQTMALSLQRQGISDSRLQSAITARAKLILGNNAMPSPQEVDDAISTATAQVTGKSAGSSLSQQAADILKNRQSKG
jgi:hypothetical protein